MARVVLVNLVMFVLPFVFYAAYPFLSRVDDGKSSALEGMPLLPLTLAGTVLVAVTLAITATMSEKHQGTYVPAVIVDGKVQPGRIK
jgi:uncharacterized oligopeptide transporter (OPT) family protein